MEAPVVINTYKGNTPMSHVQRDLGANLGHTEAVTGLPAALPHEDHGPVCSLKQWIP